jgi:hypothetical protein
MPLDTLLVFFFLEKHIPLQTTTRSTQLHKILGVDAPAPQ